MAATYTPIATTTLGSAGTITFSSIPGTYTDLKLIFSGTVASANQIYLRFNNDSTTTYSITQLNGNGTSATSGSGTNTNQLVLVGLVGSNASTTIPNFVNVDIFNYAGSTFKTSLFSTSNDLNGSGDSAASVGMWRSTSAITSINLSAAGGNFNAGTTATLYGIKAA